MDNLTNEEIKMMRGELDIDRYLPKIPPRKEYWDIYRIVQTLESDSKQITALEAELKAAGDHAETMEHCAREAEAQLSKATTANFELVSENDDLTQQLAEVKSIGAEYWQTLCHYDHDGISTPWPYSTGGNRQSSAIEQLAESVPFVVFCEKAVGLSCCAEDGCGECEGEYKQNCQLLKGKT